VADVNAIVAQEKAYVRTAKPAGQVEREDLGELVERKYNDGLKYAGGKIWRGMLQVGASGFGKGLLITAGVVLAVTALMFGFGASLGEITIGPATATVEKGIMIGFWKALQFLTHSSGWGAVTLAAGGTLGAVVEMNKEPGRISLAQAEELAKQYEISRRQGRVQEKEQGPQNNAPAQQVETPAKAAANAIPQERAQAKQPTLQDKVHTQAETALKSATNDVPPNGWQVAELKRRARNMNGNNQLQTG